MSEIHLLAREAADNSDLWSQLIAAAGGAVIGALAGAIPSYFFAQRASAEAAAREVKIREDADRVAAMRITSRLATMLIDWPSLRNHVEQIMERAAADGHGDMQPWQKLIPIGGVVARDLSFEADELAFVIAGGRMDLAGDLMLTARRFQTDMLAMIEYVKRRRELCDQIPATMVGQVGSTWLDAGAKAMFEPRAVELNAMVDGMRNHLGKNVDEALKVAKNFGEFARKRFNEPSFPMVVVAPKPQALSKG